MNTSRAKALLKKYNEGTCTAEEAALIEKWYLDFEQKDLPHLTQEAKHAQLARIRQQLPVNKVQVRRTNFTSALLPLAAAACFLIALSFGIYFLKQDTPAVEVSTLTPKPDVTPGGNKAFLILADGSRLSLTDASPGEIAKQAGMSIIKSGDGHVTYSVTGSPGEVGESPSYNTIETPRGGQYQINLPDGTKVWLNAASSIRFPTRFNGNERRVELTGEGYFEVERDVKKPFKVYGSNQVVEVLGTHFNINSYPDEAFIKTTLVEGSVNATVLETGHANLLKPGQQLKIKGTKSSVTSVDTDLELAWKEGMFQFKEADLETVMRQIARWYDVEVEYKNKISSKLFSGKLYRNAEVSSILDVLSYYEVRFKVEGKKIIVNP